MQSESDAGDARGLPPELQPDFQEFLRRIRELTSAPSLAQGAIEALRAYGALVYSRSAKLSLVAEGDRRALFTRHVLDSLNPLALFPDPPATAIDIGSGAGFPGIPLAIAWPQTRVILLESRERKAGFLESAVRELKVRNARVVCARLEDYGSAWRAEPQEAAFIRAVGDLSTLLCALERVCAPGARWVYFMGRGTSADEVIRELARAGRGESGHAGLGDSGFEATSAPGAFGGRLLIGRFPAR